MSILKGLITIERVEEDRSMFSVVSLSEVGGIAKLWKDLSALESPTELQQRALELINIHMAQKFSFNNLSLSLAAEPYLPKATTKPLAKDSAE